MLEEKASRRSEEDLHSQTTRIEKETFSALTSRWFVRRREDPSDVHRGMRQRSTGEILRRTLTKDDVHFSWRIENESRRN